MIKNRILYLTNHVTLSKFEIPMLQRMGYEVYMPKKPAFDISCRVDWELDDTLTIPKEDIDILNTVDFWYTPISSQISDIINKYFDIALVAFSPVMISSMIKRFKGAIVYRAYGTNYSYTRIFQDTFGDVVFTQIERLGNRFWFGSGYETIPLIEGRILRMRDVFLPLGLPNAKVNDRWIGNGHKVLFPCPKINTIPFFQDVYQKFLKDFKGISYNVCGVQPIPVKNDPNVLGYLSDEDYYKVFTTSSCMYYYSQIKTHIHYTPAEAVKWGLPLVYMAGGLLDSLGGESLPGRCKNVKEARRKVNRLVNGDEKLAQKIRESQSVLLDKFTYNYCEPIWKDSMKKITDALEYEFKQKQVKISSSRIAIILPNPQMNTLLKTAFCLAKGISLGIQKNREHLEIVFAYPETDDDSSIMYQLKPLESMGILLRKFRWETIETRRIEGVNRIKDYAHYYGYRNKYVLLNDGMAYFHDCKYLIFISNDVPMDVFTEIPYGVVALDFISRQSNVHLDMEKVNSTLAFLRNAQFCAITSSIMEEHAIQYAGVTRNRIVRIPYLVEDKATEEHISNISPQKQPYMLWLVCEKEDNRSVLNGLKEYYLHGGKNKCIICSINYMDFVKGKKANKLWDKIHDDMVLKKRVMIIGNIQRIEFYSLLKNAEYLMTIGMAYGGDIQSYYTASYIKKPVIIHDSPVTKYINHYFDFKFHFCDFNNPDELQASLSSLEQYSSDPKNSDNIISHSELTIDNENIAINLFKTIKFNCCL